MEQQIMGEQIKKDMTWAQTMDYVEELKQYGSVPGLTNMQNLCNKLDNPQEESSFIHIAGTNGKGSTLAFTSEILKAAGYRTGRYISPTITSYNERIQINGKPISQKDLCHYMSLLKEICNELVQEGQPHPTAFEIETVIAFLYFRDKKCEIVVLEAGLGGLLDATNIITTTLVSVFTSISLDHIGILGKTLSEIAQNKSGIMKSGAAAVALKGEREVMDVLTKQAETLQIPLQIVDASLVTGVKSVLGKQTFSYGPYKKLEIMLTGRYQIENAVLAINIIEALAAKGYLVSEKAIYQGLAKTIWPGRFQILAKNPLFIADGAHNRDGAARLAESIHFYFTNRRIIYIIGILRDKEQDEILKATCPYAEQILTISTQGERGLTAYELACQANEYHSNVTAVDSVQEAVELAYLLADKDTVIIAFGSLSYLGNLMSVVENISSKKNRAAVGRDSHGKQRED